MLGAHLDRLRSPFGLGLISLGGGRTMTTLERSILIHASPEEIDRLHDCGDVYVLTPLHVRWHPGPYGTQFPLVPPDFQYRSDTP